MTDYSPYRHMWEELGMNLELHDELLAESDRLHKRYFLSQTKRPQAIALFDASLHTSHAGRVAEIVEYRKKGGKSIGTFCIYVPDEIALAASVLPIPLCGGSNWAVPYADKLLPRDICPLIRSTFGMALSGTCPYATLKDRIVGETTCDAKKKTWDLLGFDIMEVPQKKNAADRALWLQEVKTFKSSMENLSGVEVTEERLREGIQVVNRRRRVLQDIDAFRRLDNPPISGLDALLVSQVALNQDIHGFIHDCEVLITELRDRVNKGLSAYPPTDKPKRILMAGTPSPMGFAKLHHIAEISGLQIVADESCTGSRYFKDMVDETKTGLDTLLEAVAERYFAIDCSCFSPNTERLDNIQKAVTESRIDGVIQMVLQYCHAYNIESRMVEKRLKKSGIPSITIVTDYSEEDHGQIQTRIEAFSELLD
ncbi:MAG: 2-hydroxyacyl-CoA dehydratase family protein [Candidatus Aminicenantes bacterium]|nr:2-hydroxyacyl-CoA dehydratase family protein [Candidatus Aminicenantes bacterium]